MDGVHFSTLSLKVAAEHGITDDNAVIAAANITAAHLHKLFFIFFILLRALSDAVCAFPDGDAEIRGVPKRSDVNTATFLFIIVTIPFIYIGLKNFIQT